MIIRLEDIPPEGLDVTVPLPAGALAPEGGEQGVAVAGPVTGEFHLDRHGPQVLVKGRVHGRFAVPCARCLGDTVAEVAEPVSVEFRPLPSEGKGEHELTPGELDVEFYQGDSLDLGEFLAEQVRLALPVKPLCSPDCPGLCPSCGRSRKEGCDCSPPGPDDRWGALRGLLKKE